MTLYDILACPICKVSVVLHDTCLHCTQCERQYPVINGVPVMLPEWDGTNFPHEGELIVREGYDPWIHRMVLQSLNDNQIVVDAGCGNMTLDDPCIIRLDASLTPYVDVVGDMHQLPFKPGSIDYIFSLAVVEHLRQPFIAAEEMYTALKPGGFVYGECCFVFPYHGVPHHYFNASFRGMQQVFAAFRELKIGVASYQMPSFAVESLLNTYLALFNPQSPSETKFVNLVQEVMQYPLRSYDAKFSQDAALIIAAGSYFLGIKQPNGNETIIPPVVLDIYLRTPALQVRYPDPNNLALPDNLMIWARNEGHALYPEIATYFDEIEPFSKYSDPAHPLDRSKIKNMPVIAEPYQSVHVVAEAERETIASVQSEPAGVVPAEYMTPSEQKSLRMLLGEAARHYHRGGLRILTIEVLGYLQRQLAKGI